MNLFHAAQATPNSSDILCECSEKWSSLLAVEGSSIKDIATVGNKLDP